MKKVSLCLLILILCLLSGCTTVKIDGIENFSEGHSSVSLTENLIPSKEFLKDYEYIAGDYHYFEEKSFSESHLEVSIMVLKYETDEYQKAKEFCLEELWLSEENAKEYNGYIFKENLSLPYKYNDLINGVNEEFPHFFNMFSYNDDKCEIVSIGFWCGMKLYDDANLVNEDFGAFLQKYYSKFYDFG